MNDRELIQTILQIKIKLDILKNIRKPFENGSKFSQLESDAINEIDDLIYDIAFHYKKE